MGQLREVIDRATDAMLADDLEEFREAYAPDVVVTTPDSGTFHGVDALYEWNHAFKAAFPDSEYEEQAVHETSDCVISQGDMVGTHTEDFQLGDQTVPATGRQVRLRVADIAKVEAGKITRHDFYFDQMAMAVQLGLMEAPARSTT